MARWIEYTMGVADRALHRTAISKSTSRRGTVSVPILRAFWRDNGKTYRAGVGAKDQERRTRALVDQAVESAFATVERELGAEHV